MFVGKEQRTNLGRHANNEIGLALFFFFFCEVIVQRRYDQGRCATPLCYKGEAIKHHHRLRREGHRKQHWRVGCDERGLAAALGATGLLHQAGI